VFNGTFSTSDDDNNDNASKTHPREKAGELVSDSTTKSLSVVIQSFSSLIDHVTRTYYFCSTVKTIYPCKITMKKISAYFF